MTRKAEDSATVLADQQNDSRKQTSVSPGLSSNPSNDADVIFSAPRNSSVLPS